VGGASVLVGVDVSVGSTVPVAVAVALASLVAVGVASAGGVGVSVGAVVGELTGVDAGVGPSVGAVSCVGSGAASVGWAPSCVGSALGGLVGSAGWSVGLGTVAVEVRVGRAPACKVALLCAAFSVASKSGVGSDEPQATIMVRSSRTTTASSGVFLTFQISSSSDTYPFDYSTCSLLVKSPPHTRLGRCMCFSELCVARAPVIPKLQHLLSDPVIARSVR
jgi:hypothetical protein